jgi:hypothetical protein
MIVEVVSGRTYYGRFGTGRVLLVNGHPEWHGPTHDAKRVLNDLVEECHKLRIPLKVL